MKLLILSGDEKMYSAALAVMESSQQKGADTTLLRLSELSFANGSGHRRGAVRSTDQLIGKALAADSSSDVLSDNLERAVREGGCDSVICADLKAVKAALDIKNRFSGFPKFYGVLTDTDAVKSLSKESLDGFFVPHKDLAVLLKKKGVKGELYTTGVPVEKGYFRRFDKKAARNYLVIPENRRVYLLLSDGISYEEIRDVCDELLRTENENFLFYVFVSRGCEKGELLKRRYQTEERVQIITLNKKLSVYMESADVILTKPEGYESYEAAAAGVPLVHLMTVRGPASTAQFFSSQEMSLLGNSVTDAVRKARRLIEEKAQAKRMVKRQSMMVALDASDKILDRIILNNQRYAAQGR